MRTCAMPQEIEVWYIIPALRRELTKALINNHNLSQKEVAKLLGITEAAISQYMHSKRAKELAFTKELEKSIKEAAQRIVKDPKAVLYEMNRLCTETKDCKFICDIHHKYDKGLTNRCEICFK